MPTISRILSKCAGCVTHGGAAGGGRTTTIGHSGSTLDRASVIATGAGAIVAGTGGETLGALAPLFLEGLVRVRHYRLGHAMLPEEFIDGNDIEV
jgi:hypothetical protein